MTKIYCNHCGMEIDPNEEKFLRMERFSVDDPDNAYYGTEIDVHLCMPCLERLLDWMFERYAFSPVAEPDGGYKRHERRRLYEKAEET